MIVGIIADTHDNLPKFEQAVDFFNKQRVSFVFHAGDFVAPFAVSKLKKLSCDWRGVFGNNDGERAGLAAISESKIKDVVLKVELHNRKIVVVHDIHTLGAAGEKADAIICGHTHKPEIRTEGKRVFINPGECCGWLSGVSTVALLDLEKLSAQVVTI
jgi:putative phosphoesterase